MKKNPKQTVHVQIPFNLKLSPTMIVCLVYAQIYDIKTYKYNKTEAYQSRIRPFISNQLARLA